MSQNSDETKLHSLWSRTPGKQPPNASYYHQSKHISSSSESSGVGRTPNWSSEADNKFNLTDTQTHWSGTNNMEFSKKLSWDENSNCKNQNNMTFGFQSQWSTNSNEILPSRNPAWGMSQSNTSDYVSPTETGSEDHMWNNLAVDAGGDHFLSHSNSIWSTATPTKQRDNSISCASAGLDLEQITTSTPNNVSKDSDSSHFPIRAFNNSAVDNASTFSICDYSPSHDTDTNSNQDKSADQKATWAQAAGKGVSLTQSFSDDGIKPETDDVYSSIINRVGGWGNQNVDQTTPWLVDDSDISSSGDKLNLIGVKPPPRSSVESNVWTNEPPNGVGVWESHYEHMGERTARWSGKPKSGWDSVSMDLGSTTQWNERDEQAPWSGGGGLRARPKQPWIGPLGPSAIVGKPDSIQSPIGSGIRNPVFAVQRNTNAAMSTMPLQSELGDSMDRHGYFPNQGMSLPPNARIPPNAAKMGLIPQGMRPDDGQMSMYNANNADMVRPAPNPQPHPLGMRGDWGLPDSAYRPNPIDEPLPNMSFMPPPPPMPVNSATAAMKNPNMFQQQMQQIQQQQQTKRFPSENQIALEKQIGNEIRILQHKQMELSRQSISLQNISGSNAIVMEVTRTLNAVKQQLATKDQTLKLIRSQMPITNSGQPQQLSNGMMHAGGSVNMNQHIMSMNPRNLSQTSSGQCGISDLSAQMNDMKFQKNRVDLWSQGNMPSPNAISPYMGMDKPGVFYHANNANTSNNMSSGGPPLSMNSGNFPRPSQANFMPSSSSRQQQQQHHQMQQQQQHMHQQQQQRASQMWAPTRIMQSQSSSSFCQSSPASYGLDTSALNSDDQHTQQFVSSQADLGDSPSVSGSNNQPTTSALSLPQILSSGTNVSSAFNPRDISALSANISEFVPGQPWPGVNYAQQEDPNITLGTGPRSLLSITNDHLEKLANSGSSNVLHDVSNSLHRQPALGGSRLPSGLNGTSKRQFHASSSNVPAATESGSSSATTYVLIRDLPTHINTEMLRNVINAQRFPGLMQMHPNLIMKFVLLHFSSSDEAKKAHGVLSGQVGNVELLSDQDLAHVTNNG